MSAKAAKPQVAFFDFACCEGCQLQIANLEEDVIGLTELVDVVEFREVLTAKADSYDIAFIEGSITRKADEARIKDIRARSKMLVAFGQCAVSGGINKLKNNWDRLDEAMKQVYGDKYNMPHLDTYRTKAVNEVVQVDFSIPGCPINKDEFLRVVKELVLGKIPKLPNHPVCVECKMNETECLFNGGIICMGPIARAGCGAPCPDNGAACEGCRGTVDNPNMGEMRHILQKYNYSPDEIDRKINIFGIDPGIKQ